MSSLTEILSEFLNSGEDASLFAGAGVAMRAGLPDWADYLTQIAELARPHDVLTRHIMYESIGAKDYSTAAEYYLISKKIPEAEKYANLTLPLRQYNAEALRSLLSLPFSRVVTTNFDRAMHSAFANVTRDAAEEVNLSDPTLAAAPFNSKFYIARIHGRVEAPETIRLSESHFRDLASNVSVMPRPY